MPAAEKRKQEQEVLKASRIDHILECTFSLFSQGIENVTMNEIADNAEIGVASLYRYFSTKDDLAIECASYAWKKEEELLRNRFVSTEYMSLSGYEQLRLLLGMFPEFFKTEGKFFRFIYYFDAYIKVQNVTPQRLTKYEATILGPTKLVTEAIRKGRSDGSLRKNSATDDELYITITHALFSLAQKLSLSGEMLYMDKEISAQKQMELLTSIILDSLKE